MIYVYTIPYPTEIDKDDFIGLFFEIDNEGIEEKETEMEIYLTDEQVDTNEALINDLCEDYKVSYIKKAMENKNWNEQWESSFQPITIDDFVQVRATFHAANTNVQHEIIIEPKMSFGTGHHATTAQMMQLMQQIDFTNKSVLDIGSGTGILAILADKLGADECIAIDNDEWCYTNALENINLNNSKNIKVVLGDSSAIPNKSFDIILANIHRNFLVENMQLLSKHTKPDGYLLVSGFYTTDEAIILESAMAQGLVANYRSTQDNWSCIVLKKNL